MNYKKHNLIKIVLTLFLLVPFKIWGQEPAWWEPSAPVVGQNFTVFYDDIVGTLPDNSPQCWLHWGVVDTLTGNWSAPPPSSWPPGSILSPDGYACQSPMTRGSNNYWQVTINPDTTIWDIEFVFTDHLNHWDNNNNQNWEISFISSAIASWWYPDNPLPGDLLTIYYNTAPGTLPSTAQNIKLHWGINELGFGNWQEPPISMWPPGTVPWGDNHAVQSPMTNLGEGIWQIEIQTNDTTYSLHYVFTDGSNWDNNNNTNWNIYLQEPPPLIYTYHTFSYDTRSAFATYGVEDITTVRVAGTFNNWSTTANPLSGPDSNGVYNAELHIPAGYTAYKFVINSNIWVQDPDNPLTDGSTYMNSVISLSPDTLPYFTQVLPPENSIFNLGDYAYISAIVRPSDMGPGIMGTPTLQIWGSPIPVNYDPATGVMTATVCLTAPYLYDMVFSVTDSAGNVGEFRQNIVVFSMMEYGFGALDTYDDDNGPGTYTYPIGQNDAADFYAMWIIEEANGDSINFDIKMADITYDTRVLIEICTEIEGMYFDPPLFAVEIATPDWNGNGVQICLADPNSPTFDPSVHNILIIRRDPIELGATITVSVDTAEDNWFDFSIALSDLEAVMGSYNRPWYYGAFAFLEDPPGTSGHSWEIDEAHGGVAGTYDPDIFDAMFMDNREVQKIVLSNYSLNRMCTMDNVGRGFVMLEPEQIGPNIGSSGPEITILTRGAPTIIPYQTITGIIEVLDPTSVLIHQLVEGDTFIYNIPGVTDTFELNFNLWEGGNTIWGEATVEGETGTSPAIVFDLTLDHTPEPFITTGYDDGIVTLDASASFEPDSQTIAFEWSPDPANPTQVLIDNANQAIASFTAPENPGEYYVNVTLTDPDNNVSTGRTLATVYPDSVHPFEWNESVQWVQDAIVYEIFPRSYSSLHQLSAITADMERLSELGITAIWLMPIFPGPTDHGYEVTDYYGIEEDYGTPEDFSELVETAHSYDIKVLLDLVINHTSIQHPFMQDALDFGIFSHYYDYYDRDAWGNYTYYYDWISMPNLNYDNMEVWDYFIEVSKYWVETYNIDGYRCDVAWGPQSRNPDFWVEWREELKKLKPELLLLAEATSTDFTYFNYRFDSAFDWNLHHEGAVNFTNLFNGIPNLNLLQEVIVNYGYPYPQYHYPFRFMENHDEARYISYNTPDETKLVATLLFTIPGIPMLYAGQEIGTVSQRGQIFWGSDPYNLYDYYYKLVQVRRLFPSLRTADVERLNNTQYSTVYSIGRYKDGEDPVVSVMNFANWSQVMTVTIPVEEWGIEPDSLYCLNEFIGNTHSWLTGAQLSTITTSIDAKKARVYSISDSAIILNIEPMEREIPYRYELSQSYPNPFNDECVIKFSVPIQIKVNITVYNILGQKVRLLSDAIWETGVHTIKWDGKSETGGVLSSGMYFYRMQAGDFVATRKVIIIK